MLRFALAATILAGALPAAAQRAGAYAVEGRGADGTTYVGAVNLQPTGPQTWRVTWRVGGETARGVGLTMRNTLVVGYVLSNEVGVASYEVQPDGRLVGRWTQGLGGAVGSEVWLPR
ncbi:hypothetical protein [Roseococcus sp. YIM B11640]|uniref:hypothetical protein n=1 Tax=Roseococcus sp. YIM B11640 TaxID=3133973 RepID=UPI003C7BDF2C